MLSDRVAIVDHGRLVALDTPIGLIDQPPDASTPGTPATLEDVYWPAPVQRSPTEPAPTARTPLRREAT
ncbi:MAG TPA: hypothetical protein VFZ70_04335 [Euzebyales bacterium]